MTIDMRHQDTTDAARRVAAAAEELSDALESVGELDAALRGLLECDSELWAAYDAALCDHDTSDMRRDSLAVSVDCARAMVARIQLALDSASDLVSPAA